MQAKHDLLNYIEKVKSIISPVNISDDNLEQYIEYINQAELIVPVVGGFSAGKSTLINSFIDKSILPTGITPETSLATELRFSETEYIEAVNKDESIEKFAITEFESIKDNAKQFKFIKLYLNNAHLKAIQPLVLVDMPGFDSPLDAHNQAILNYLSRGVYFIFLASVEEGTVSRNTIQEINNLNLFSKGFSFCLSKTNLRPQSDVLAVQSLIKNQLESQFDFTDEVILLDDNSGENLNKILTNINPNKLFKNIFIEDLQQNNVDLMERIELSKKTLKAEHESIDEALKEMAESLSKTEDKKKKAIAEIKNDYSHQKTDVIASNVERLLNNQAEYFASLAISNKDHFLNELSSSTKSHLLREVQSFIKDTSVNIIEDFSCEIKNISNNTNDLSLDVEKMGENISKALDKSTNTLDSLSEKFGKDSGIGLFVATILKFTTKTVAPILTAVIAILPEILPFFKKQKIPQQEKNEIEIQIRQEIIPNIKANILAQLPSLIQSNIENIIEQVSKSFEEKIKQKQQDIESAQKQKEEDAKNTEYKIENLNNAKKALKEQSQKHLF